MTIRFKWDKMKNKTLKYAEQGQQGVTPKDYHALQKKTSGF